MQENINELTELIFKFYPQVRKACRSLVSIKDLPISMTQLSCLHTVEQSGEITMSSLADKLQMSNQQLTKVVDNLVEFDMIGRKTDSANRRRILVAVTPKGEKTLSSLRTEVNRKLTVLMSKMPEAEINKLYESIKYIDSCFDGFKRIVGRH